MIENKSLNDAKHFAFAKCLQFLIQLEDNGGNVIIKAKDGGWFNVCVSELAEVAMHRLQLGSTSRVL